MPTLPLNWQDVKPEGGSYGDKYIRVATTLYKIVQKPLQSGDLIEMRIQWNYDTLKQDQSKSFLSQIEKFDGFCCVPSHTNYQRTIRTFLNDYEPIEVKPRQGNFPTTEQFLRHIFGNQYAMGLITCNCSTPDRCNGYRLSCWYRKTATPERPPF